MTQQLDSLLGAAVTENDVEAIGNLMSSYPELAERLNEPVFPWGMPPLPASRSRRMVDVLLDHGADVEKVGEWWGPGFGLHQVLPEIGEYLIELGAPLSVHAAAAMGLSWPLHELLVADPSRVNAPGGDGGTPLHFARTVDVASLLVEHGALLDACDEDHDSTPAQWRIGDAPDVTRYLLAKGARADLFMAAGLGDLALARRLVGEEPDCTTVRIGNNRGPFPGIGFEGRGGTIYQWTLGFNHSPQEIAFQKGHADVYEFLMSRTPPKEQLLVACMLADRPLAQRLCAENAGIIETLDDEDLTLLAKCCWETNLNVEAVRLMLDVGFPVDVPEPNHGYSPLHNAAWCGSVELVDLLLQRGHPPGERDPEHHAMPAGWAIYCCTEEGRHPEGKYPEVIDRLLAAGAPFDESFYPVGHAGIDAVIKRHLVQRKS